MPPAPPVNGRIALSLPRNAKVRYPHRLHRRLRISARDSTGTTSSVVVSDTLPAACGTPGSSVAVNGPIATTRPAAAGGGAQLVFDRRRRRFRAGYLLVRFSAYVDTAGNQEGTELNTLLAYRDPATGADTAVGRAGRAGASPISR
jgi:hypothetical protein